MATIPTGPSQPSAAATDQFEPKEPMHIAWIVLLGFYHIFLAILFMYLIAKLWPLKIPVTEGALHSVSLLRGRFVFDVTHEMQVLLLVILAGGLGSFVHGATSFVNFVGARTIISSWRWWYLLRPFIGMGLALGFYFAIRAGFFATGAGTASFNTVGFTAAAFLVGMFTRQATEKLSELFTVLFRVHESENLTVTTDKLKKNQPETGKKEGAK